MNTIRSQDRMQAFQSTPTASLLSSHAGRAGFDIAKVDALRAAIASGRFQVDPQRIATGLMADARASAAIGLATR